MTSIPNSNVQETLDYHEATKHTAASVRTSTHRLDFSNQPRPWKLYQPSLPQVQLSTTVAPSGTTALESIGNAPPPGDEERIPTLEDLSALLLLSAGVTKSISFPGGRMSFRAAACTGALYHIELYVVAGELPGLEAGVYHYGVHDNRLSLLREGDHRSVLVEATAQDPEVERAPALIIYTSIFWRNAWKYQARAYRHTYWDSGTILANSLSIAAARKLPAKVVAGFVDEQVDTLVDVDGQDEASVALLSLGSSLSLPPPAPSIERLGLSIVPYSRSAIDYPAISRMHKASTLSNREEAASWREAWRSLRIQGPAPQGELISLADANPRSVASEPLENVIIRRGSSRRFQRAPISQGQLSTILSAAIHPVPFEVGLQQPHRMTEAYLIVNGVDGLESGAYVYRREEGALERLKTGNTRRIAARLALEQDLGGDAAVNVYFLADLPALLNQLGNRAYRVAHLDASITAGRLYLASHALGLGASGLTFYDDEVTDFFAPHATGKSVMFLIALGLPTRRVR